MEATIIRLDNGNSTTNSDMVVRTASFEEAFGDYSEARGKGRAKRKARKKERIANKREVRTERRKLKGDRQQERIARRSTRKGARQEMRAEQQEARMGRRTRRQDMRQQRTEARGTRKMTKEQDDQERENYALEQENYRDSITPQEEEGGAYTDEQGGGYTDEQGGGYSDEQGGGYSDAPSGGGYSDAPSGGGYSDQISEDWATPPQGYDEQGGGYSDEEDGYYEEDGNYSDEEEGAYGDDNRYDSPYIQEETEFNDDSYFNVEGMANNNVVPPAVADKVQKLKNNEKAFKDLSTKRNEISRVGNNTKGIDFQIEKCYGRICQLRKQLEGYCNADGNPNERKKRKRAVGMALGLKKRKRKMGTYGGSEVPVNSDLNPEFSPNRIEIPATSSFDAYSDLGRPVIIDGVTQSDYADYSNNLLTDGIEPTKIDLFSNFDGGSSKNGKAIVSVAIGIGVGVLALYVAKKKGWI